MSGLRRWWWAARTAGRNLWGSRLSAAVAAGSIALTLILTCVSLLMGEQVQRLGDHWTGKVDVSVFLCTRTSTASTCAGATTTAQAQTIGRVIESTRGVSRVVFEDREAAWEAFVDRFAGSEIVETVTADAIPESFRIRLEDGADRSEVLEDITAALEAIGGYERVQDQRELLAGFFTVADRVRAGALVLAGLQALISLVLLSHLLRSSIENRRKDIRVMSLVGTPRRQIRAPFVLEGIAIYIASVCITAGVVLAGLGLWKGALGRVPDAGTLVLDTGNAIGTLVTVATAGMFIGWTVTRISLWQRLRGNV
jgi:cell division transport system permease protein